VSEPIPDTGRKTILSRSIVTRAPTIEALEVLYEERHPVMMDWIREAANYLAPTVAMLENIFDPETVIFGGGLPDAVLDAVVNALEPLPMSVATRRNRGLPRVMRGQTGQLTAALGAAALPLLNEVSPHLSVAPAPQQPSAPLSSIALNQE